MSPELDKKLCAEFPNLYRARHADKRETCMCWGFPGDGWYKPLHKLSKKLEKLILALPEQERAECCAMQVKEKFGGLRFYMTCSTPEMDKAVQAAEHQCAKTCEQCGAPGTIINDAGWYRAACKAHAKRE